MITSLFPTTHVIHKYKIYVQNNKYLWVFIKIIKLTNEIYRANLKARTGRDWR